MGLRSSTAAKAEPSSGNERLPLNFYKDLPLAKNGFDPQNVARVGQMQIREGDIFVVTYPKSGTTWTQYMIWSLIHNPEDIVDIGDMFSKLFPFLENYGPESAESLPKPRTMKLHSPIRYSPFKAQAKYVIVVRNPFDVCVSFYYYVKEVDSITCAAEDLRFDEFFEFFMDGRVPFGDYFDFINGWFQQRHKPNVLFLHYEDCKADQEKALKEIAGFIGEDYRQKLEEDPEFLKKVLTQTSFDYMKEKLNFLVPATKDDFQKFSENQSGVPLKRATMFRKGQVGDWSSHFSEGQKRRLLKKINKIIRNKEFKRKLIPPELL